MLESASSRGSSCSSESSRSAVNFQRLCLKGDLLNGGLRAGENKFRVEITPLDDTPEANRRLEIAFFVLRDGQKLPPKQVFHYKPGTVPPHYEAPVWVNAVTLQDR